MKKLIINNTVILFLQINDFTIYEKNNLLDLKKVYLKDYDNCLIYNYFDLKNKKEIIRDRINKIKHEYQTIINARKCEIKEITNNEKNLFLNKYHIQGTDKSQFFYGAFYNNELLSVITFDISRGFNGGIKENECELSRFVIKSNCIITGLFNKMIKVFIKNHSPRKIISFADLNTSRIDSNIYKNSGFILDKIIHPDFKYYLKENNKIYHKFSFGTKYDKNTTISDDLKLKTKEQLIKVWNCGKLKYELFIDENNQIVFGSIYKIINKINNKIYIGQTTRNLQKRITEHKSEFNLQTHNNKYLLNAFNKYGWDNFEFSIIDTAKNLIELNNKEVFYIDQYKSNDKNIGYNIEMGGNNALASEETREKMSKTHLGIKQSPEWVDRKIAKAGTEEAKKYGRIKTKEERKYLSDNSPKFWEGKTRDEETKTKISKTKLERGWSDKQKLICKKVYKIDKRNNEIIETFDTTALAALCAKVDQSTMSRWCMKDKIVNEFIWSYNLNHKNILNLNKNNNIETANGDSKIIANLSIIRKVKQSAEWVQKRIDKIAKPVIKLDLENNIIEKYPSLADAGRKNKDGLGYQQILRECLGYSKGNTWCYEEDYLNNTIKEFKSIEIKTLNDFTKFELQSIYDEYKNYNTSIRELSAKYSINFSTLSNELNKLDTPINLDYNKNKKYILTCKKTGKTFTDFKNGSGVLTTHITETYPDFKLESKFKRKQIEVKTGKSWFYEYFTYDEVNE